MNTPDLSTLSVEQLEAVLKLTKEYNENLSAILDPNWVVPPRFEHDCSNCVYLGREGSYDLYFHETYYEKTVIARHSSVGHDYSSGLAAKMPELVEAKRRAKERGLL